jgi:predicted nuclease with RNAse H fold
VRALGIDVGTAPKWLDVVVLDGELGVLHTERRVRPDRLPALLARWRPDVVAIDSPPSWGCSGRSRAAERALAKLGVHAFPVPSRERAGNPFFAWMRVGFRAFRAAARAGYPRYRTGPVRGMAIEVFPHASAVALANSLPPPGVDRRRWRRQVLAAERVPVEALASHDQVDAALAALTGVRALEGGFVAVGDPEEGTVVLPVARLGGRFERPGVALGARTGSERAPDERRGAGEE